MNPKELIPHRRPDGLIELLHPFSGEVVAVQGSPDDLLKNKSETMVSVLMPGGNQIFLDKHLDPGILGSLGKRRWQFSETLVDIICERIRHGESPAGICRDPGMPPYSVICKWRRESPQVEEALVQARQDRAEIFKDQTLEEADKAIEEADSEQAVAARKLKIDTLKWVAGVDHPERFGQVKKDSISVGQAVIMIDTGIKRDPPRDVGGNSGDQSNKDLHHLESAADSSGSRDASEAKLIEPRSGSSPPGSTVDQ